MPRLPKQTVARPTQEQLVDLANHQAARDHAQALLLRLHRGVEAVVSCKVLDSGRGGRRCDGRHFSAEKKVFQELCLVERAAWRDEDLGPGRKRLGIWLLKGGARRNHFCGSSSMRLTAVKAVAHAVATEGHSVH